MNRAGMDGRKAQAPRMLVILILVAVGIASTLMFQNQLFAKVNEKGPKEICKASVYQYALGSFQGINFVEFLRTTYTPDGSYRYVNYLTNTNWSFSLPPGSSEQFNDAMSTEQDYVVMYRVDRKGYWLGSIIGSTAVSSGCIAGTWAGGPTGFVIGCGLGLIGGGIGYVTATEDLHHEASIVVKPSHLIREDGCKVLYQ